MCLAIPARVIKIKKNIAEVEIGGVQKKVDIRLLNNVCLGDYLLIHAGFGISKINKKEAKESLKLLFCLKENEVF